MGISWVKVNKAFPKHHLLGQQFKKHHGHILGQGQQSIPQTPPTWPAVQETPRAYPGSRSLKHPPNTTYLASSSRNTMGISSVKVTKTSPKHRLTGQQFKKHHLHIMGQGHQNIPQTPTNWPAVQETPWAYPGSRSAKHPQTPPTWPAVQETPWAYPRSRSSKHPPNTTYLASSSRNTMGISWVKVTKTSPKHHLLGQQFKKHHGHILGQGHQNIPQTPTNWPAVQETPSANHGSRSPKHPQNTTYLASSSRNTMGISWVKVTRTSPKHQLTGQQFKKHHGHILVQGQQNIPKHHLIGQQFKKHLGHILDQGHQNIPQTPPTWPAVQETPWAYPGSRSLKHPPNTTYLASSSRNTMGISWVKVTKTSPKHQLTGQQFKKHHLQIMGQSHQNIPQTPPTWPAVQETPWAYPGSRSPEHPPNITYLASSSRNTMGIFWVKVTKTSPKHHLFGQQFKKHHGHIMGQGHQNLMNTSLCYSQAKLLAFFYPPPPPPTGS